MAHMRVKLMIQKPCNYEIDKYLVEHPDELPQNKSIKVEYVDENADDVEWDDFMTKATSRKAHCRRDGKNGLEKKSINRLETMDAKRDCSKGELTRKTRNGATVKRRKNDGVKAYFKGKKLWNRSIRHEKILFDENDLVDVISPVEQLENVDAPKKHTPQEIHEIIGILDEQPKPTVYIMEYVCFAGSEDHMEDRVYCTTISAVYSELVKHETSDIEDYLHIIGLYPSDVGHLEEYRMYSKTICN